MLTTQQGTPVADDQNSLKVGRRGPTLLEDHHFREDLLPDWRKLKLRATQEVVIAGYTRGHGRRAGGFGALVAGVHDAGVLRWAGNVGTGFSDEEIERLRELLAPLERVDSPFAEVPKMPRVRRSDLTWVEPDARCRDRVRRMDARRTPAGALVSSIA